MACGDKTMIKTDKREKFIKRLNISKVKTFKQIDITRNSVQVDKGLEIDKLFDEVKKKYTLGSRKNIDYVKMEFKKFYE